MDLCGGTFKNRLRENYTSSKAIRLYVPATTREPSKNNGEPVVLMGLAKENRTPRPEAVLLWRHLFCVDELQKGFQWLLVLVILMYPPSSGSQFTGLYFCLSLNSTVHSKWLWNTPAVEPHKGLEMAKSTRMQLSFCSSLRRAGRVTSESQIGVKHVKQNFVMSCIVLLVLLSLLSFRLFTRYRQIR